MKRKIFGVGETVLDVIFKNDEPQAAVPGGSAFNAMISLGRSVGEEYPEIPIKMITETGDDHIGDIVVNFMKENNVDADCVTRNAGTQTHISMAFLNEKNDAQYEFYKDHAHASLKPESMAGLNFQADDILLTSSYFAINPVIRDYTQAIYEKAHQAGTILYYDINFRKSHEDEIPQLIENINQNIALSDVVRASSEDCMILFGTDSPTEIYKNFIADKCPFFICTDGSNPLTVITPEFTKQYEVTNIKTVSTIGAGDNFNAGFIYGLVKNNICKKLLKSADESVWDKLICSGQNFSSMVCQSIFNYIPKQS